MSDIILKVDAASGLKVEVGDMVQSGAEIGIEPDTEKPLVSPVAGVIKGTLEVASFGVMTAPLARGFVGKVLNSKQVKAALAKWYVVYAKTVGTEVTTEIAQTKVDQIAGKMALLTDNTEIRLKMGTSARNFEEL